MADLNAIPGLKRRISSTRARMSRLALFRAWWPFLGFVALFLAIALAGLFDRLAPATAAGLTLAAIIAAVLLAIRSARRYRSVPRGAAEAVLDRQSELRPISGLRDRPARPQPDGRSLWQMHTARLAEAAAGLKVPGFGDEWRRCDPAFLRFILPLVLIGLTILAGSEAPGRLQRAALPDIAALAGADDMTIEAWITPPEYSGKAPVFLEADMDDVRVPAGAVATIRAFSRSAPKLKRAGETGTETIRFEETPDGAYEARTKITGDTELSVRWWGERAAWNILASPDAAPSVSFASLPELTDTDRIRFDWTAQDDYGVETLELRVWRREPHPAAPDAEERLAVDIVGLDRREAEDTAEIDATRHRWAGLPVNVQLVATDAAGQEGVSETVPFTLPEKLFLQPLAKAAQEARVTILREPRSYEELPENRENLRPDTMNTASSGRLSAAPQGVRRAALMLDALTYAPEDYFRDRSVYLGLRMAHSLLETAPDKAEADSVEPILWAVALKAEYGDAADALRALKAARKALEQALRDGAPEDEIRRLMKAFKEAANNYLAARMAEAIANGLPEAPNQSDMEQQGGPALGGQDFEDMLSALEDLAETGASDQARQLLSDITNMLENLEFQQGGSGEGGFPGMPGGEGGEENAEEDMPQEERELTDALERLSDLLREQRELNDDTLAEQRGERRRGNGPSPFGQQDPSGQGEGGGETGEPRQGEDGQGGGLGPRQRDLADETDRFAQGRENGDGPAGGGEDGPERRGFGALEDGDRERLEAIRRLQERAARELERGNLGRAERLQDQATRELRDLSGELAAALDDLRAEEGRENAGQDPFGRPLNGGSGVGENVTIPEEAERQRAKDILEELRRRFDETENEDERDYLERLLDRF
ncbi:MAG: DUF4175 family protein [Alphaproteobacteria bacterium]|nr:DUF4175 family protein [Alphaproteobacteria bacterium]